MKLTRVKRKDAAPKTRGLFERIFLFYKGKYVGISTAYNLKEAKEKYLRDHASENLDPKKLVAEYSG